MSDINEIGLSWQARNGSGNLRDYAQEIYDLRKENAMLRKLDTERVAVARVAAELEQHVREENARQAKRIVELEAEVARLRRQHRACICAECEDDRGARATIERVDALCDTAESDRRSAVMLGVLALPRFVRQVRAALRGDDTEETCPSKS